MDSKQILLKRVSDLISLADRTIQFAGMDVFHSNKSRFRSQSLQFIQYMNGTSQPNYSEFERASRPENFGAVENCKAILEGIRHDIENDYYFSSIKGLVSAEIFSGYLDMAEYLLSENYYIPAAILVGSTLEQHLKKLCQKNGIALEYIDARGKEHNKTGNDLNRELYKNDVYNKIEMALIEGWQKIRNEAAHGNYDQFTKDQVINMHRSVVDFIGRNPL